VRAPGKRTLLAAQDRTGLLQGRSRAGRDREPGVVQGVRDRPASLRIGVLDENAWGHDAKDARRWLAEHEQS
jgi:hypothetical protein